LYVNTVRELEGFVKFFAFDCQIPAVLAKFKHCEKTETTPFFSIIRPPNVKINPYTNKPMPFEAVNYQQKEITP
jgi:hypothetical protein